MSEQKQLFDGERGKENNKISINAAIRFGRKRQRRGSDGVSAEKLRLLVDFYAARRPRAKETGKDERR